jgi:hypothetical protein
MANKHTAWKPNVEQLVKLYESGMTQSEVATRLGVTQKMVWRAMRTHGVQARVAAKRDQRGSKNDSWKKGSVTYAALHYRVMAVRGKPKKCQRCGTDNPRKTYDWANLTGNYDDPNDYERMCRSCHWKYDKKHLNFHGATGGRPSPPRG